MGRKFMNHQVLPQGAEPVKLSYEADLCGNIEQALKGLQGYGIMALELIQNADDAGAASLCFDARAEGLYVSNSEKFTSCGLTSIRCPWEKTGDLDGRGRPCNFHAISRMGSRSKIHAPEQIGRFGIGFVSVYQITDTPIVRSAGTEMRLNPLTGEALASMVEFTDGTQFELPWASGPSEIRDALNASPTPADVIQKVVDEISAVLRSSLLFLRHIERVEVRQSGTLRMAVDIERNVNSVTLTFEPDRRTERWLVLSRNASDIIAELDLLAKYETLEKLDRSRTVSVAIAVDAEPEEGLLYAYLPTQQKTGMALHVNADFFPHASRQDIVLKGEGHERYWNEAMLATAAAAIGENFVLLRDKVGHSRLWELGSGAFRLRENGAFAEFWTRFADAARNSDSVWTTKNTWHAPTGVHLAPEHMPYAEQAALTSLGIELLDQSLRPHWTALSSVGVGELRLLNVTAKLEALNGAGIAYSNPHLKNLWAAVARLIQTARGRVGYDGAIKRLKAAIFLIDIDGDAVSPDAVWRTPDGVLPALVRRYAHMCPIVHSDVLSHSELTELIDEYTLDDFANKLAEAIDGSESAERIIGVQPEDVRDFYTLLTSFPADPSNTDASDILAETPCLRTPNGFVSPSRGQLPGGFSDPMGYFQLIDRSLFPARMDDFAQDILGVSVLSFHQYIDDHLEDILAREPTKDQYRDLLIQIVDRKNELDDQGSLELLAEREFVRTRAGKFERPGECYFWTASLETLLGEGGDRWVDNGWMPPAPYGPKLQDLLENRLGMPNSVAPRHVVERLEAIVDGATVDDVAKAAAPILRYLIDRWPKLTEEDLEELAELRSLEFLPAVVDGERDSDNLYLPREVYRATRAPGFASQVPVIDLLPLRQAGTAVSALLDLLGVPNEPETKVIVDHLLQCMLNEQAPSDLTYAMLNERVENDDNVAAIDELRGAAFIYDGDLKQFLRADQVFWSQPPFGGYWWTANARMSRLSTLFRRLGVRDYPGSENYAALMIEIAEKPDLTEAEISIHSHCLEKLCEALDQDDTEIARAIDALGGKTSLLNLDGDAIRPQDALWIDAEQLASPFGSALNNRLVHQPDVARGAAARLFRLLRVRPISEVARLCLASNPDRMPVEHASESLQNRADLVLWLAPNATSRSALRRILLRIQIQLTKSLRIQAEINEFGLPVRSAINSVAAFFEPETGILHIEGTSMRANGWPAGFRTIFSEIERYCPAVDVKPLIMTAALIMLSESREEAEQALRSSGYRQNENGASDIPLGQELGEMPVEVLEVEATDVTLTLEGDKNEANDDDGHKQQPEENGGKLDKNEAEAMSASNSSDVGMERNRSRSGTDNAAVRGGWEEQTALGSGNDAGGGYKSKAGTGQFGAGENQGHPRRGSDGGNGSASHGVSTNLGRSQSGDDRRTRTSRMLAYVGRSGDHRKNDASLGASGAEISGLIDMAAINAVLRYEETRGWSPEEQSHGNPGYDILSIGPDGRRRLIEVKGLETDWTERGIKLSHVQYRMAEEYPNEYWIYVVESARDLDRQRVSAISNPFEKVEEYWFDHHWRSASEETANSHELNVREGAHVHHAIWGEGIILEVVRRGIALSVTVDFGFQGKKYIPFNSSLRIVE